MGFEPTDNGFAIQRLHPLSHRNRVYDIRKGGEHAIRVVARTRNSGVLSRYRRVTHRGYGQSNPVMPFLILGPRAIANNPNGLDVSHQHNENTAALTDTTRPARQTPLFIPAESLHY